MKRGGRARRQAIESLCPAADVVIDVGADHGHVAHALSAIATERMPGRMGRRDVAWVVADGLRPFRSVDVAIVAGMGARTIASVLSHGPRPAIAILHAQDDPPALRRWLAANGWRIEAERLAPEARRFAEVIRAVPGQESAAGLELVFGPRLLQGEDPLLLAHLEQLHGYYLGLQAAVDGTDPTKHATFQAYTAFLAGHIALRTSL